MFRVIDTHTVYGNPVVGEFETEQAASEYIATLPEHITGRYHIYGPTEGELTMTETAFAEWLQIERGIIGEDVDIPALYDQYTRSARCETREYTHGWTIAFRNPRANRFLRIGDLDLTWDEARDLCGYLATIRPELECWFTGTRAAELAGRVCNEDHGNILANSGRRVPLLDRGSSIAEFIPAREQLGGE